MEIVKLQKEDIKEALRLVREAFLEFEAPEYPEEGVLTGVIAVRDKTHICLLFVRKKYHRRGIGRRLFDAASAYFAGRGAR